MYALYNMIFYKIKCGSLETSLNNYVLIKKRNNNKHIENI